VSGESGEFEDTGNPAKNRAVSSAVTASELRVGAALSVSKNVTKAEAINLDKIRAAPSFVFALCPIPIRTCRQALYGDIETAARLLASARDRSCDSDAQAALFFTRTVNQRSKRDPGVDCSPLH
jgi:hypothetical protein